MKKSIKSTKFLSLLMVLAGGFLLASCASEYQPQPRSIGTDPSELKRSPCACLEVETLPGLPEWFMS